MNNYVLSLLAVLLAGCTTTSPQISNEKFVSSRLQDVASPGGLVLIPFGNPSDYQLGAFYYVPNAAKNMASDSVSIRPLCKITPDHNAGEINIETTSYPGSPELTISRSNSGELKGVLNAISAGVSAKYVRSATIKTSNVKYLSLNYIEPDRLSRLLKAGKDCRSYFAKAEKFKNRYFQLVGIAIGDIEYTIEYEISGTISASTKSIPAAPEGSIASGKTSKIKDSLSGVVFLVYDN